MLSPAQISARQGRLTASRVAALMSGDAEKIMGLYLEMIGEREPEDLSGVWAVQLGTVTESLNLDWYQRTTGRILKDRGAVFFLEDWGASTLDAFDPELTGPIEAKHVGGFEPRSTIVARYMPQVHWQMLCTDTKRCALSIIEGAKAPVVEIVEYDEAYGSELLSRGMEFMRCVREKTPPVAFDKVEAVPQEKWREADMASSNSWAAHAATWLRFKSEAKAFDTATRDIKALVEADVGCAYGHGIECVRNRAGALSIRERK